MMMPSATPAGHLEKQNITPTYCCNSLLGDSTIALVFHKYRTKDSINTVANMFARQLMRRFGTSSVRSHGDPGGRPGSNLPFDITNRYKLTAIFVIFFGSGLAAPFLIVRHQMLK